MHFSLIPDVRILSYHLISYYLTMWLDSFSFLFQGDLERERNMEISPMMDRDNANIEKSQVCFQILNSIFIILVLCMQKSIFLNLLFCIVFALYDISVNHDLLYVGEKRHCCQLVMIPMVESWQSCRKFSLVSLKTWSLRFVGSNPTPD